MTVGMGSSDRQMVMGSEADADQGADGCEGGQPHADAGKLAGEGVAAVGAERRGEALAGERFAGAAVVAAHDCHPFDFSTARAFDSAAAVVVAGFLPMQLVLMSGA